MEAVETAAEPAEVTPAWLSGVLRASGATAGAEVVAVRTERIGAGKMGSNVRFHLEWSVAGGGPASVVVKSASDDPSSRAAGLATGTYVREVGFYRHLAPRARARIPRCHHAWIDEATGDFRLVLEDMAAHTAGDQLRGCTPDQAAAALGELARLHGSFWGTPQPSPYEWIERFRAGGGDGLQALYGALVDGFCARYGDRLGDEVLDAARRFAPLVARWAAPPGGPATVTHGDYRLDNLLFGPPDSPVAVVDWQTVSTGDGVGDAAYFLGAGLLPDDRRRHEGDLLRHYHRALIAEGADGVSWDECLLRYRRHSLGGLLMAVVASMLVGADPRGDAMFCAMAERHTQQALDWDAFELIGR